MTLSTRLWKLPKLTSKKQNIYNILLINMTQSCQIKQEIYISLASCVYWITLVSNIILSVHVSNLFWSREYNSAKEICKYASFSKVWGNYPLDLKIVWSSATNIENKWFIIIKEGKQLQYNIEVFLICRDLSLSKKGSNSYTILRFKICWDLSLSKKGSNSYTILRFSICRDLSLSKKGKQLLYNIEV